MTLKRRYFSAPTLTQALLAAARHHGVEPEAIEYEAVEKKSGFIKAPRGVVIDVDPDAPLKVEAPDEAEAQAAPPVAEPPAVEEPPVAEDPLVVDEPQVVEEPPVAKAAEVPFEPVAAEEPAAHPALEPVTASDETPTPAVPAAAEPEPAVVEAREEAAAEVAEEPERAPANWFDADAADEADTTSTVDVAADTGADADTGAEDAGEDEPEAIAAAPTDAVETAPAVSEESAAAAAAPAEPAAEELREAVAEAVDELAFLASLRVQVAEVVSTDDGIEVELDGPDSSRLAARGGRALLAMQHLLPRLLFGRLGKAPRCRLDSDGFHAARGERLERLAQKAADRVRSGGRSWLLEPMAPDERRLVHLALAEVADIETESVGQGFLKRVRVTQAESASA